MATYKVPQDVEADDKLLGPFTFRQFIYLIIVALAGALAWGLAQVFIVLALIPMPVIFLFGALALPLRKDQPMEIYLAAMISFYLKPRQRLWDPEGVETLIEVTAPKVSEEIRTKELSETEASRRLGYLANIVDSGGWAIRGTDGSPNSAMISDVFYDAQNAQDVLDTNNTVAQSFNYLIDQSAEKSRQEALDKMRQMLTSTQAPDPSTVAAPTAQPLATPTPAGQAPSTTTPPVIDPYVQSMHQKVIQPIDDMTSPQTPIVDLAAELMASAQQQTMQGALPTPPVQPAVSDDTSSTSTSDTPVSADIINLATNPDLSIETLAKEANRLQRKANSDEELVISLR